jgi:hypothetical protein
VKLVPVNGEVEQSSDAAVLGIERAGERYFAANAGE